MRLRRKLLPLTLTALAYGQAAFEVATVRPTPEETRIMGDLNSYPGGRVRMINCRLIYLIETALSMQEYQVIGGPGWIRHETFDIEAKPPAASKSSTRFREREYLNEEQREMLLTLLVERFQLKFHRETKQGPAYFLVTNNKKLKMEISKDEGERFWEGSPRKGVFRGDGIAGRNITMPEFAARLSRYLERPVFDKTGLEGRFDFRYEQALEPGVRTDIVSSLLTQIQELGLKLEAGKGPTETVVIDRVEKLAEN